MSTFAPRSWLMLWSALRGAVIGLVVWEIFALSFDYADRAVAEAAARATADLNGVEVLGSIIITGLSIAVPASLLTGLVVAWVLRLRQPWAVPLVGLLLSLLLTLLAAQIIEGPLPGWGSATILGISFAVAALVPPNCRGTVVASVPVGAVQARESEVGPSPHIPRAVVMLTLEELRGDRDRPSVVPGGHATPHVHHETTDAVPGRWDGGSGAVAR